MIKRKQYNLEELLQALRKYIGTATWSHEEDRYLFRDGWKGKLVYENNFLVGIALSNNNMEQKYITTIEKSLEILI